MAITMRKYVDITSGVGGASQVAGRELIARLFSSSPVLSPSTVYEMTSVEDVASYFGVSSSEYAYAAMYFGTISKSITKPSKISFYRYAPTATFARLQGIKVKTTLAQFQSITSGTFSIVVDGMTIAATIDLSAAVSLADVALKVQTALSALQLNQLTFNATDSSFRLQTYSSMVINQATGTVAVLMGLDKGIAANGAAADANPLNAFMASDNLSSNFGSFAFIDPLSLQQHQDIAAYNTTLNVKYVQLIRVLEASAATWSAALMDYSGISLNLYAQPNDYLIMGIAGLLAATDYTRPNSTINFMYHQLAAPVTVTDTMTSNAMDALRVNYYGQTQTAGHNISFYQRGLLTGLATAPTDINTYANEMWFKDSVIAAIMNLFLAMPKLAANATGRSQVRMTIQSIVEQAVFNGTVSVGKTLDNIQRTYVTTLSNDITAWRKVEQSGYWLNVVIQKTVAPSGSAEYKAVYTLIYAKDDVIRKVEGSHVMI
jgi:Protein of unknown function (DUF3383)